MNQKTKITAAIAAVMDYIHSEAAGADSILQAAPQPLKSTRVQTKLWGMSGRQEIMQMRSLMQFRALKTLR